MLVENQRSKKQQQDGASEVPLQLLHQMHVSPFADEEMWGGSRAGRDMKPWPVTYVRASPQECCYLKSGTHTRISIKSTKDECLQNGP